MSQNTLPGQKELPPRPKTRTLHTRLPPFAYSTTHIPKNRLKQGSLEQQGQTAIQRKTVTSNGEYLQIRFTNRQAPSANQLTQHQDSSNHPKKTKAVSVRRQQPQPRGNTSRPPTTNDLGDKAAYFDEFLSNQDALKQLKVMSHIGKGAFSVVSLAVGREKSFAIKTYEKIEALDWNRLAYIKREIRHLRLLDSPRVVKLVDLVKQRRKLYLVMENAGKQSLAGLLRKEKTFTQQKARKYFKEILEGIDYCHKKGVCHRDLKPQNILINEEGNVKLIDFGFSANSRIPLTNFCGTPAYMCPELVRKMPYNGSKADVWALGVILYLLLVGIFPFRAGNELELYRLITSGKVRYREEGAISDSAKRVIGRMLQVNPEHRPTAGDLLADQWVNA